MPTDHPAPTRTPSRRMGAGPIAPGAPDASVQYLRGVGPARAAMLARLGITTVSDLLWHVPRRHEDRRNPTPLAHLQPGREHAVVVRVDQVRTIRARRGLTIVRAGIVDATGAAVAVWFNQGYLTQRLARGQQVSLYGRVERAGRGLQFTSPELELLDPDAEPWNIGRLVPIYPLTEGLTQRALRAMMREALTAVADRMPDPLPDAIRAAHEWPPIARSLWAAHFPDTEQDQADAHRRLAFEELFVVQVGVLQQRAAAQAVPRSAVYATGDLVRRFIVSLPFALTAAQRRAIDQITADLHRPSPMNRLLQGDVGSGKTVVACAALVICVQGGYQGVLMAPTEILAEQHALTLRHLLAPLSITVDLLVGSMDAATRAPVLERLRRERPGVVVGTHALLEEPVTLTRLGVAVIDEQHRFGVMQRSRLRQKGTAPDVLVMTATPIPRTLVLTVYGDLDVSVLDEMPAGRQPIATLVRPTRARPEIYAYVRAQVAAGRQAYVVCALIEDSDALQAQSAVQLARELSEGWLRGVRVEVLHGRLAGAEKAARMDAFRRGAIDVLVATTVIEVGVDVPNASLIVVEDADRYGLAQLHQLRGRIGRGPVKSHCVLVADPTTDDGRRRLEIMRATADGFRIAQEDLQLRGPGEVLGTRQHGVTELRVANPATDLFLMEDARRAAETVVGQDPHLAGDGLRALEAAVRKQVEGRSRLVSVG